MMRIYLKNVLKSLVYKNYNFKKWFEDQGDLNLRFDYELDNNSVFFELGGFEGNYSKKILSKFSPHVYIFEPDKDYYNNLLKKFKNDKKVSIYNFALSDIKGNLYLTKEGENSYLSKSFLKNSKKVKCIKLSEFMRENQINKIDLLNMNIEGSEYKVLNDLIKNKEITKIKHLQVQFHKNIRLPQLKKRLIQIKLRKTHKMIWSYSFVWERWDKK